MTPSYLSRLISPENLPNIGLFAVGTVGIFVALCTLRAIKRQGLTMIKQTRVLQQQTRAAEESARAALLNAQIMINTERALIEVALVEPSTHLDEYGVELPGAAADDFWRYGIQVTNHGRTVARIVSFKVWHASFSGDFQRDRFNSSTEMVKHMLLAAGKAETIENIDTEHFFTNDWPSIQAKTSSAMLRIDVRYEDILKVDPTNLHETSVIFLYNAHAEEFDRLNQYNEYT
ncbi:MAG: hypothetical protein WB460_11735 [Candidatus Acidiferrales bacterium]